MYERKKFAVRFEFPGPSGGRMSGTIPSRSAPSRSRHRQAAAEKYRTHEMASLPLLLFNPAFQREEAGRELGEILNGFLGGLEREKRVMFLRRYWYGDSSSTTTAERFPAVSQSTFSRAA